jgi:hypothetical protein
MANMKTAMTKWTQRYQIVWGIIVMATFFVMDVHVFIATKTAIVASIIITKKHGLSNGIPT